MPWIQYISFFVYRPTEVLLYCWHTGTHGEMAMLSVMGGCYIQDGVPVNGHPSQY